MANKFRGEVPVTIAGTTYTVALTLEALGVLATVLEVEDLGDLETRLLALKIADMGPIMRALLETNGHPVDGLNRMSHREYIDGIRAVWNARPLADEPTEAPASPRKRASS